jgi:GT2 family glycosyltransferase
VTTSVKCAVAISTLDRPDALAHCLDALWLGDVRPAQIVIVDQSRDDTTQSLVAKRCSQNWPILYLRQEPRGLAASQNLAIAHTSFPVVAVTDDDCIPDREWLAAIEKAFASMDSLVAVTGRVLPLSPDGDKLFPVSSRTSTLRREFSKKAIPWIVGSGNNFAVKREWFARIGGCDERLGPGSAGQGGVDMDLFYRLLRAGGDIRYEPEMLVYHERQTKAGRLARRSMYGHGMGACCSFWLRERDFYALPVLGQWVFFRSRLLAAAALRFQWTPVYEEVLMLTGTVSGLVHGAYVGRTAKNNRYRLKI